MISYISGVYAGHSTDAVVIECGGIGFCIRVPETVLNRLPAKNSEFKLYTYLHVKEDAMQLYGFISKEEQEMFELLIGVSGIGPKGALGFSASEAVKAVSGVKDIETLSTEAIIKAALKKTL